MKTLIVALVVLLSGLFVVDTCYAGFPALRNFRLRQQVRAERLRAERDFFRAQRLRTERLRAERDFFRAQRFRDSRFQQFSAPRTVFYVDQFGRVFAIRGY